MKNLSKKQWLKRLLPVVPVMVVALAVSAMLAGQFALATTPLNGSTGQFDASGMNSAIVNVGGVDKGCIGANCTTPKQFTVSWDAATGTLNVTAPFMNVTPTVTEQSTSTDANDSDSSGNPTTSAGPSHPSGSAASQPTGNTSSNTTSVVAGTKGMITVEGQDYDEEGRAAISGTASIKLVYLISCSGGGDCEYTIDVVIDLDQNGSPTGAYVK